MLPENIRFGENTKRTKPEIYRLFLPLHVLEAAQNTAVETCLRSPNDLNMKSLLLVAKSC